MYTTRSPHLLELTCPHFYISQAKERACVPARRSRREPRRGSPGIPGPLSVEYRRWIMKEGIHPDYVQAMVTCSCGHSFETRATQAEVHTDICSVCHPFYTGKQRLVDTAGRVERFKRKYDKAAK